MDRTSQLDPQDLAVLEEVITQAQSLLQQAALKPSFDSHLTQAFGPLFAPEVAAQVKQQLASGRYRWPKLEVRSRQELQGALGAYGAETQTVYLSADFLQANATTPEHITAVLLEEFGHYLDTQLNPIADSPGDEGEIFSALEDV